MIKVCVSAGGGLQGGVEECNLQCILYITLNLGFLLLLSHISEHLTAGVERREGTEPAGAAGGKDKVLFY